MPEPSGRFRTLTVLGTPVVRTRMSGGGRTVCKAAL